MTATADASLFLSVVAGVLTVALTVGLWRVVSAAALRHETPANRHLLLCAAHIDGHQRPLLWQRYAHALLVVLSCAPLPRPPRRSGRELIAFSRALLMSTDPENVGDRVVTGMISTLVITPIQVLFPFMFRHINMFRSYTVVRVRRLQRKYRIARAKRSGECVASSAQWSCLLAW